MRRKYNQKTPLGRAAPSPRISRRSKKTSHPNSKYSIIVGSADLSKTKDVIKSSVENDESYSSSSNSYSRGSDSEQLNTSSDIVSNAEPRISEIAIEMKNEEKHNVDEENKIDLILDDSCSILLTGKIEPFHQKSYVDRSSRILNENITKNAALIFEHNKNGSCTNTDLTSNCGLDLPEALLKTTVSDNISIHEKDRLRINSMTLKESSTPTDEVFKRGKKLTGSVLVKRDQIFAGEINEKSKNVNETTRKRKWLSKRSQESKEDILSISSDSLQKIMCDVLPVSLSDVKLDSSSEVEVFSDKSEVGFVSPKCKDIKNKEKNYGTNFQAKAEKSIQDVVKTNRDLLLTSKLSHFHKPSPPKNESSTILFITNLVRPFTLLQLKGLLARTGKIIADGFWIDRIKSKCYVQYDTEEQAVETRHALHGVHWPPSNPKCLNVDFGSKTAMEKAVAMSRNEMPVFGKDSSRDNQISVTGLGRDSESHEEKKVHRVVREWDVGKREDNLHRDKEIDYDVHDRSLKKNKEGKEHKGQLIEAKPLRTCSVSPNSRNKKKKENDPPLRLLDDLFRKTRVAPCIYWLPLTPEQVTEKETFRLNRMAEHQERIKKRELEKEKDTAREKVKECQKDREKDRGKEKARRRHRSNDRNKCGSRENRRY